MFIKIRAMFCLLQLSSVTSPSVEFDVGGQVIQSRVIHNTNKNPNFDEPLLFLDLVSLFNAAIILGTFYLRLFSCMLLSVATRYPTSLNVNQLLVFDGVKHINL